VFLIAAAIMAVAVLPALALGRRGGRVETSAPEAADASAAGSARGVVAAP